MEASSGEVSWRNVWEKLGVRSRNFVVVTVVVVVVVVVFVFSFRLTCFVCKFLFFLVKCVPIFQLKSWSQWSHISTFGFNIGYFLATFCHITSKIKTYNSCVNIINLSCVNIINFSSVNIIKLTLPNLSEFHIFISIFLFLIIIHFFSSTRYLKFLLNVSLLFHFKSFSCLSILLLFLLLLLLFMNLLFFWPCIIVYNYFINQL